MKIKKTKCNNLIVYALLSALGELLYIGLVVLFLQFGNAFLPLNASGAFAGVIMLLLFVFSALVSGLIVLAYPAMLALKGEVKPALTMLGWTAVFLLIAFLLAVLILAWAG
ncbi:hypothetical protein KJ969_02585 [Patescibacteria group bacterium]|nr:hypothetical protein [Patescibacteria group bacterium]MBU1922376.1 hypothetical protein [Patescibacteria group bacterium]